MSDETPAREPIGEDARIDALEDRLKAARLAENGASIFGCLSRGTCGALSQC